MAEGPPPASTPPPDAGATPGPAAPPDAAPPDAAPPVRPEPLIPAQHRPPRAVSLDPAALRALRSQVAGPVLVAGIDPPEALAAESRAWNLAVQHQPAVVVGAARTADVVAAVRFAGGEGLSVAVQSTGHGAEWAFEAGLLITTSRMADVVVDPATRSARVGAGAVWAQVVAAAEPYHLVPLSGSSSGIGVVGYTLGGGMGLLARRHGFAADHVRSLDVVTADGQLRYVDAAHEADLFWALCGGKGSFGVVTALELDLIAVDTFTAGALVFDGSDAAAVVRAWQRWAPGLPEEVTTSVALVRLPDAPFVPEHLRGGLTVHVRFALVGSQAAADRLLEPLRRSASALVDDVIERPYREADEVHRDPVDPMPVWHAGVALTDLPREAVDALLEVAGPAADVPLALVEVRLMGGALARLPARANAVAAREAAFSLQAVGALAPDLGQAVPAAGAAVLEALRPWHSAAALTNLLGDLRDRQRLSATWSFNQQARLRATKTIYDADDMFSHGHSVPPSVNPADRAAAEGADVRPGRYWDVELCRWVTGRRSDGTGSGR